MDPFISALVCAPALVAIGAIGLWVWLDHVTESRREVEETPLVAYGRLAGHEPPPVGRATVPPRSHRARGWTR